MKTKILWFLLMALSLTANVSFGQVPIAKIFLVPASPAAGDSVTVNAVFTLPSSCDFVSKGLLWQYVEVWDDTLCSNTAREHYLLQVDRMLMQYTACLDYVRWDTLRFSLGKLQTGEYCIDLLVTYYDLSWTPKVSVDDTVFSFSITPTKVNEEDISRPEEFELSQNYPNPFNPSTTIDYTVEKDGFVNLTIYNLMGQKVRVLVNEERKKGNYSVRWNGKDDEREKLPAGVYFYVLKTGDYTSSKKMILLK